MARGGHAQLSVLSALAASPNHTIKVTLVTPSYFQYYSGMLPGWMVGNYSEEECRIDLRPLAKKANVKLLIDSVIALDANQKTITTASGQHLNYDLLSLNTGSESNIEPLKELGDKLISVKPLDLFYKHWLKIISQASNIKNFTVAIIGGGAGGIELALAVKNRLSNINTHSNIMLISGNNGVLSGHSSSVKKRAINHLINNNIEIINAHAYADKKQLKTINGECLPVDLVLAASGAKPPTWLINSGLELSRGGFVVVDSMHQSTSHPEVFAAGDVCERSSENITRSGVHAIHAGSILAKNISATLEQKELASYIPRRHSLYLLSTGKKEAIMSWGKFSAEGRWVWLWKNYLDKRFIQRYNQNSWDTSE